MFQWLTCYFVSNVRFWGKAEKNEAHDVFYERRAGVPVAAFIALVCLVHKW
jgi:hypothetical protein